MDGNRKTGLSSFFRTVRHRVGGLGGRSAAENERRSKLRDLIQRSREELTRAPDDHGALVTRLYELERTLDVGEPSVAVLRTVEAAMLPLPSTRPRRLPSRGGRVTDDGLPATRVLLVELQNRIVTFDKDKEKLDKDKEKKEGPKAHG